jgi:hypothetical protein
VRAVAGAVLATAVLGTMLNDSGVSVWTTMTAGFVFTVLSLNLNLGGPRHRQLEPGLLTDSWKPGS